MTEPAAPHGTASTLHSRLAQPPPCCRSMEEPSWPSLLHGELDITGTASVIATLTAAAAGNPRIVVDLAARDYIDCHALGALGRVRAQARQAGGDLLLAAPGSLVRRLLDLTGLIGVFAVHASVEEAGGAGGSPVAVIAGYQRQVPASGGWQ